MSDKRESDAEYLKRRHWIQSDTSTWIDPLSDDVIGIKFAVAQQTARDEQEERAVVGAAIANAASRHCKNFGRDAAGGSAASFVKHAADLTAAEYRARFARKVSE